MKNLPSVLAAIVLVTVLVLYMCTFQIRSTEVAIVKTFGNANPDPVTVDEDDKHFFAGLRFKWPWPIQSVETYDRRIRLLEDRIEEAPTKDSKQIILTTYTAWTIADPYKFHTRYQTIAAGERALRTRMRSFKKSVIGNHNFSDFVSTQAGDRKLLAIEDEILAAVQSVASDEFGIDIQMFGIKQLALPESVTKAVFDSMKALQEKKASQYRSEGQAEGKRIVAEASAAAQRVERIVGRKVSEIEAIGLREVGRIYGQFNEHPELRIYLDQLNALEKILATRTEIFMDTDFQPMNLWDDKKRMPDADPLDGLSVLDNAATPTAEPAP